MWRRNQPQRRRGFSATIDTTATTKTALYYTLQHTNDCEQYLPHAVIHTPPTRVGSTASCDSSTTTTTALYYANAPSSSSLSYEEYHVASHSHQEEATGTTATASRATPSSWTTTSLSGLPEVVAVGPTIARANARTSRSRTTTTATTKSSTPKKTRRMTTGTTRRKTASKTSASSTQAQQLQQQPVVLRQLQARTSPTPKTTTTTTPSLSSTHIATTPTATTQTPHTATTTTTTATAPTTPQQSLLQKKLPSRTFATTTTASSSTTRTTTTSNNNRNNKKKYKNRFLTREEEVQYVYDLRSMRAAIRIRDDLVTKTQAAAADGNDKNNNNNIHDKDEFGGRGGRRSDVSLHHHHTNAPKQYHHHHQDDGNDLSSVSELEWARAFVEAERQNQTVAMQQQLQQTQEEKDGSLPPNVPISDRQAIRRLRWVMSQGQAARTALCTANVGLVTSLAKKHYQSFKQATEWGCASLGTILTVSDFIQEGNLGLMEAAERFCPERGVRFSTYAVYWIRQRICRSANEVGRPIRLPAHVHGLLSKVRRARMELLYEQQRQQEQHQTQGLLSLGSAQQQQEHELPTEEADPGRGGGGGSLSLTSTSPPSSSATTSLLTSASTTTSSSEATPSFMEQLAQRVGVTEERLRLYQDSSRNVVSLEAPLLYSNHRQQQGHLSSSASSSSSSSSSSGGGGGGGGGRGGGRGAKASGGGETVQTLGDLVASDAPTPEEEAQYDAMRQDVWHVMATELTPVERQVILHRFGFLEGPLPPARGGGGGGGGSTVADTARALNLSRDRVRLVEARALNKLRHPQKNYRLRNYLEEFRPPAMTSTTHTTRRREVSSSSSSFSVPSSLSSYFYKHAAIDAPSSNTHSSQWSSSATAEAQSYRSQERLSASVSATSDSGDINNDQGRRRDIVATATSSSSTTTTTSPPSINNRTPSRSTTINTDEANQASHHQTQQSHSSRETLSSSSSSSYVSDRLWFF